MTFNLYEFFLLFLSTTNKISQLFLILLFTIIICDRFKSAIKASFYSNEPQKKEDYLI
jgi:hypothetical protein